MTDTSNAPLPPSARPALWTAAEAAAATSGTTSGNWTCTGVSIDSRTVDTGDLFIAIAGPTHDGHAFVSDALANGAVAAMVHRVPDGFSQPEKLLVVEDTFTALQALAEAARERLTGKVIAVTGSVGKTGTKEMLTLACGALGGIVHATQGNLNNHWGLPLTLARCPRDAAWCILEMGMNHAEEIRPLSRIARPHVAVITAVEAVHLEHFDDVEDIARAKAEILDGVVDGGTARPCPVTTRSIPCFWRRRSVWTCAPPALAAISMQAPACCTPTPPTRACVCWRISTAKILNTPSEPLAGTGRSTAWRRWRRCARPVVMRRQRLKRSAR